MVGRIVILLLAGQISVPGAVRGWREEGGRLERSPDEVGKNGKGLLSEEEFEEKVVERIPIFTTPPLRKLVNEGDVIRLPCFVDRLEGFVLFWKRGDSILSIGERLISFADVRASIDSEKDGNWLIIEGSKVEDGGEYTCHITAFPPQEISHIVKIRTRPIITSTKSEVITEEGVDVTIECSLKGGEPTPEISWTKDDDDKTSSPGILGYGPRLTVANVTCHDAGMYRCHADNGFPTTSADVVALKVRFKPHIDQSNSFVHSSPNQTVILTCNVQGFPEPAVTWARGSFKLSSLQYNISGEGPLHTLTLPPEEKREGNYSCVATNKLGKDVKNMILSKKMGPVTFTSSPVQNSTSSYVLKWVGISADEVDIFSLVTARDDGTEVSEFVINPNKNLGKEWFGEYVLTGLKEATVYVARVAGVNSHGQGPYSPPFRFGTRGARLAGDSSSGTVLLNASVLLYVLCLSILFKRQTLGL